MVRVKAQMPMLELALLGENYLATVETKAFLENTKQREDGGRVLDWLRGILGAGKTVICSTIIEHLEDKIFASKRQQHNLPTTISTSATRTDKTWTPCSAAFCGNYANTTRSYRAPLGRCMRLMTMGGGGRAMRC
jgi:hypothetical protein